MNDLQNQKIDAQLNDRVLTDSELAEAAGGLAPTSSGSGHEIVWIYSGFTQVGSEDNWYHNCYYFPCPRCGKPMHSEFYRAKWYCDPCNYSEFRPSRADWPGTRDELIAAAK